jgi:hypothetical protein
MSMWLASKASAYWTRPIPSRFADIAHALSCSSSAFAFFKSSVSKPSVNQP